MSEIEKMYRTAKVVPSHHYCNECQYNMSAECPIRCPDNVTVYPPFTAEKQLLLLQFIEKLDWIDAIVSFYYMNEDWVFLIQPVREFANEQMKDFGGKQKDYAQALAQAINTLWQSLTEEERKQIKEILE